MPTWVIDAVVALWVCIVAGAAIWLAGTLLVELSLLVRWAVRGRVNWSQVAVLIVLLGAMVLVGFAIADLWRGWAELNGG